MRAFQIFLTSIFPEQSGEMDVGKVNQHPVMELGRRTRASVRAVVVGTPSASVRAGGLALVPSGVRDQEASPPGGVLLRGPAPGNFLGAVPAEFNEFERCGDAREWRDGARPLPPRLGGSDVSEHGKTLSNMVSEGRHYREFFLAVFVFRRTGAALDEVDDAPRQGMNGVL